MLKFKYILSGTEKNLFKCIRITKKTYLLWANKTYFFKTNEATSRTSKTLIIPKFKTITILN